MKKLILLVVVSVALTSYTFAQSSPYPECDEYASQRDYYRNQWYTLSYSNPNYQTYYSNYQNYYSLYNNCATQQSKIQLQKEQDFSNLFKQWYDNYERGDYLNAVSYYEQALQIKSDSSAQRNLSLSYQKLWIWFFNKKEYDKTIEYMQKYLLLVPNNYEAFYNIWLSYSNKWENDNALKYFELALQNTFDKNQIDQVNKVIELLKTYNKDQIKKSKSKTNDPLWYQQYYLDTLNIFEAQKKIKLANTPIIAVIDDWVNINHPDLSANIWINKKEIPWNKKDDDNNWYIDDYNWWNFVYNSNNLIPLWSHGTMVAGIIGAKINNNEWIAWIVPNVKIMPIWVLDLNWNATNDKVIKAIEYAINNGANIINLSLWWNQFTYSDEYDEAIKKANSKWILVVVAAWNGDLLSDQEEWVDTSINKISPLCNDYDNFKMIIGVWSLDETGYRANRSNYWSNSDSCVDFYAPWVNIISTSILDNTSNFWKNYSMQWGTSFSAPMVAWILWLWYSNFGRRMKPWIAYEALLQSLIKNSVWNSNIDASKFIDYLNKKIPIKTIKKK